MSAQTKLNVAAKEAEHASIEAGEPLMNVDGALWVYHDGAWGPVGRDTLRGVEHLLLECCEGAGVAYTEKEKVIWKTLLLKLPMKRGDAFDTVPMVAFDNGVLFVNDGEFSDHDSDILCTRRVGVPFDPSATCPEWIAALDRALEDKSEEDREAHKTFLQQWFGMAILGFNRNTPRALRKLLLVEGPPGTAKTSIADVARELFGEDRTATGDLKHITSKFGTYDLVGAKAWVADDAIGPHDKISSSTLKKIVTGESQAADIKGKQSVQFRFQGPCLITTNNLPKIDDSSHALYGRVVMFRLTRQFTSEEAKVHLQRKGSLLGFLKHKNELPGIVNWALAGAITALENEKLHDLDSAYDSSMEWRRSNDPVFSFITAHCEYDPKVMNYGPALTLMISVYSEMEFGKRMSPATVRSLLPRELPTTLHGVKEVSVRNKGTDAKAWVGVRVSDEAIKWLEVAKEKGLVQQKGGWPSNVPSL